MQVTATGTSAASDGARWRWSRASVVTLAALTGVNLFNYIDRFVMSVLAPELGKPVESGGLGLDKGEQGMAYSAFIVVYALTSPVFGYMGDRMRRLWIIAGAVMLWSVATGASGLVHSLLALLVARACTGIGEAAYASIAPSVISDVVPLSARGRALAIFNAAIPIGSALGFMLGAWMAVRYGWRHAFIVAALPGLLLAIGCLFIREPVRGAMDGGAMPKRVPLKDALRRMMRREYALPVLGYVLQTAGFGALGYWAPSYLEQAHGMDKERAGFYFGLAVVATGFLGTIAGGWIGDRWLRRNPQALMWVCGLSSVAAVPFIFVLLHATSDAWIWTSISAGCFLLVMSVGPVNAQIVNTLHATDRALGVAVCTTLIHLLGDVPSVPLIGELVDTMSGGAAGSSEGSLFGFVRGGLDMLPHHLPLADAWRRAMYVVPASIALGGVAWLVAALWKRPARQEA